MLAASKGAAFMFLTADGPSFTGGYGGQARMNANILDIGKAR
jgi:hypothetical protein